MIEEHITVKELMELNSHNSIILPNWHNRSLPVTEITQYLDNWEECKAIILYGSSIKKPQYTEKIEYRLPFKLFKKVTKVPDIPPANDIDVMVLYEDTNRWSNTQGLLTQPIFEEVDDYYGGFSHRIGTVHFNYRYTEDLFDSYIKGESSSNDSR